MLACKTYQVVTTPKPLREPLTFGAIRSVLCDGPRCRNRSAPVFLALGVKGALALCQVCRAWHQRVIREALPDLKRRPR